MTADQRLLHHEMAHLIGYIANWILSDTEEPLPEPSIIIGGDDAMALKCVGPMASLVGTYHTLFRLQEANPGTTELLPLVHDSAISPEDLVELAKYQKDKDLVHIRLTSVVIVQWLIKHNIVERIVGDLNDADGIFIVDAGKLADAIAGPVKLLQASPQLPEHVRQQLIETLDPLDLPILKFVPAKESPQLTQFICEALNGTEAA